MASQSRQYGRRSTNYATGTNIVSSDSGVPLSPSSTVSTTTPPRRYVLDVPTSRSSRANRISTTRLVNDNYEESRTRSRSINDGLGYSSIVRTDVNDEYAEELSRSNSRDYYYRNSGNEYSGTLTQYADESSIRELIQSNPSYTGNALDDEEVRALTAKATPEVRHYPINADSNPELIVRPNNQRLTYTQDIAVRYLRPSTPPPPGPIIIREIRAPAPPPAPPIILRQKPPPPRTPSPVIIRERPPPRPKSVPTTVVRKIIPPPPPPPRKLIIERYPKLPSKPRPVLIERWLPYQRQKRQVILEKAKPLDPTPPVKNTIIEWRSPEVEIVKQVKQLGVQQADPEGYYNQYGDKLYATDFVQRKLTELGLQEEIALIQEQQRAISQEELVMEQADEEYIRKVLNSQSNSSQQTYTGNAVSRIVQSTVSGFVDEYNEEQRRYQNISPSNSAVYTVNGYTREDRDGSPVVLTEDMLLRSYSTNDGKFPTHLLSKLGSQIYDMPSDQVDLGNTGRRSTTTTKTTRYYTVNQNEPSYDDTVVDEVIGTAPRYTQETYIQVRDPNARNRSSTYEASFETRENGGD